VPRGVETPIQPAKVVSDSAPANEVIDILRDAAKRVQKLGDQLARQDERICDLAGDLREAQDISVEERWREPLDDFRLGILDRDELLDQTIGNSR